MAPTFIIPFLHILNIVLVCISIALLAATAYILYRINKLTEE